MAPSRERFGNALRRLREARGLTATELARESHLSPSMISRLESGGREPSLAAIGRLAGPLAVPQSILLLTLIGVEDVEQLLGPVAIRDAIDELEAYLARAAAKR